MQNASSSNPFRHVAVFAFPFGNHVRPLLDLTRRMATAAPSIRFTFFSTESSNATHFRGGSTLPNIVPTAVPEDGAAGNMNPMESIPRFLEAAPVSFRRVIAAAEAEAGVAVECVIADAFLWWCGEIAEEKGVKWVPYWCSGPNSFSAHVYTYALRAKFTQLQDEEDRIADCVPGYSFVRFVDLPNGVVAGDLDSPFSQMTLKAGLITPKASVVVMNSLEELFPTITIDLKSKMRLLSILPSFITSPSQIDSNDEYGCLSWLGNQNAQSVAYISFGTFANPPQHELIALANALEEIKFPFIWSISDAAKGNLPSSFLKMISKNEKLGKIVPWAPQRKILTHPATGVFITHCGWNSMMESIVSGVPLICRSIIGDQMLNQRFIECEFKFGIGVDGGIFTKDNVVKALHQVLSTEDGKQMRKKALVLKELVEEGIRPGGSSHKNFISLMELITNTSETASG